MEKIQLTPRREQILRLIIQEYIQSAQPVSSKVIADKGNLGVSPATVRNDMAALEKAGLLTHPHTSAGRIPTHVGYRYYVQNLINDTELSPAERLQIKSQFSVAAELDQWLQVSTSILAHASQSIALATQPKAIECRFKHIELVGIHEFKALMVLVLKTGIVKQQMLDLETAKSQEELTQFSNELNAHLDNQTAKSAVKVLPLLSPFAQEMAVVVLDLMNRVDTQSDDTLYRDGLVQVLDAPEFAEGGNVRNIVQILEERTLINQLVDEYADDTDIRVIIAGNGRYMELQEISVVMSPYGVTNLATGVLGVVGPLRMSYSRTIGTVRYVAALMSDIVEEMYS